MILAHGIQQTPGIFYPRKIKEEVEEVTRIPVKKKKERASGRISGEGRTKVLYIYIYMCVRDKIREANVKVETEKER